MNKWIDSKAYSTEFCDNQQVSLHKSPSWFIYFRLMNELRKLDIIIGIKAEQSLRDAVRAHVDGSDETDLELTPVGRKDWVAGQRFGSTLGASGLEQTFQQVHKKLLELKSHQRIRRESLKLYVVQLPVPVFKDPVTNDPTGETPQLDGGGSIDHTQKREDTTAPVEGPSTCPICNRTVHSYNLHYNTDGKVVGCFMCGGQAGGF